MAPVYLDFNATTPLLPEVVEAMTPFLTTHFGNPSSSHVYGRTAKDAVEGARAQVAALLHAPPECLVFTSGGTEATALALRGTARAQPQRRHFVTSSIEHPATARVAEALTAEGGRLSLVPVDARGVLNLDALKVALKPYTLWLSLIHAHNETGVLQPVAEAAKYAHQVDALVHADASQSAGKVPVAVDALGVDCLTLAAHKLYGPKGVGALYVRPGVQVVPLQVGGGQEHGRRSGTENVASIVGFGAACAAAARDLESASARVAALRDGLWEKLRAGVPGLLLAGEGAPRLPNTLYVLFPRASGNAVLAAAPEVAASTGSACHDGRDAAPHVLTEMALSPETAVGAVRLTLGRTTTSSEVETAAAALIAAWKRVTGA
ncbi:MAG: cysteine desulfurase [Myxococcales bacterium]|nr:cysteine desulfurase [Myxococcales bacterium]